MKHFSLLLFFLLLPFGLSAQTVVSGRVVDEQSQPMPFVNVVLLAANDSSFLQGVVTKDDGTFALSTTQPHALLRVSYVGYVTQTMETGSGNMGTIQLKQNAEALKEVVVKAHAPAFKLTTEGFQTNVENTVLSKLGTGEDVLAHVPGLTKKKDGYEVFGKGAPIFYINGRQVRDMDELKQLKSEEIKSVEVINNPGARYNASVNAVVKIRTKNIHGEGFGFDIRSVYYQSENTDLNESLNWNYRHNRFDLFGGYRYTLDNSFYHNPIVTLLQTDTLWRQVFQQDNKDKDKYHRLTLGANYQLNDSNSVGVRYLMKAEPSSTTPHLLISDVTANGVYYDHLENKILDKSTNRPSHQLNIYYNGKLGKVSIDWNADYMYSHEEDQMMYNEVSTSKNSRVITSKNVERNRLLATKLVFTYPLFGGNLSFGGEYTHTNRVDDYINPEGYVPTSYAKLKETNIAPFMEYSRKIAMFNVSAGLRYEHVGFDYYENNKKIDTQSRSFGNFFPSLALATQIGKVQLQLGYSAKTKRPSYSQLSNNVVYGNRFLLQSGNPLLHHEYVHNLSLAGSWKFIELGIGYTDRRHAIILWSEEQSGNSSVSRITYKNIPSLKRMTVQLALSPEIGIWSPEVSLMAMKQWLNLKTNLATYRLNKPIFQFSVNNTLNFGHGWLFAEEASLTTMGNAENGYVGKNNASVDVSLTKTFAKDRCSLRIQGTDIFHTDKSSSTVYTGIMKATQVSSYDSRQFVLTFTYKFNTTRSKYKGTGAGNEEKNRL